jgi:hypothetical protein
VDPANIDQPNDKVDDIAGTSDDHPEKDNEPAPSQLPRNPRRNLSSSPPTPASRPRRPAPSSRRRPNRRRHPSPCRRHRRPPRRLARRPPQKRPVRSRPTNYRRWAGNAVAKESYRCS